MKYFYIDPFGKICSCVEVFASSQIPEGAIEWPDGIKFSEAMDWHYNATTSKFVKVDYTTKPSVFHRFNVSTMEWEYVATEAAMTARSDRDSKLAELDILVTNPLRWGDFSEDLKQKLAAYRKALLDVPQQPGYPLSIVWPIPPTA